MANITITDIDLGPVVIDGGAYEHGALLTFGGADSFPAGTILARHTGTLKFIPYVKGGSSNGNGVPRAVLTYDVSKDGSGDLPVDVLVGGMISKRRLIIDAQGDGSAIDGNVLDLLRQTGFVVEDVVQNSRDDNPQAIDS